MRKGKKGPNAVLLSIVECCHYVSNVRHVSTAIRALFCRTALAVSLPFICEHVVLISQSHDRLLFETINGWLAVSLYCMYRIPSTKRGVFSSSLLTVTAE